MKKIIKILFLLVISTLLFSCVSSVGIGYMEPAEVDMGHYRNIGIASTVPFDGFVRPRGYIATIDEASSKYFGFVFSSYGFELRDQVARYATDRLYRTLEDTDYFNIASPSVTDSIISISRYEDVRKIFKKNNIDAVIIPKIESMSVNEWIHSKVVQKKVVDPATGKETIKDETVFYYTSEEAIVYTYTVIDTQTEKIVARKSFSRSTENTRIIDKKDLYHDIAGEFYGMIDGMQYEITNQLVPEKVIVYETLMDNKPEIPGLEAAYEAVDDGRYGAAYDMFYSEWQKSHHVPSGYNAALLVAASGHYEDAIRLLDSILSYSPYSGEVSYMRSKLSSMWDSNRAAEAQQNGENPKEYVNRNSGIYDSLINDR